LFISCLALRRFIHQAIVTITNSITATGTNTATSITVKNGTFSFSVAFDGCVEVLLLLGVNDGDRTGEILGAIGVLIVGGGVIPHRSKA